MLILSKLILFKSVNCCSLDNFDFSLKRGVSEFKPPKKAKMQSVLAISHSFTTSTRGIWEKKGTPRSDPIKNYIKNHIVGKIQPFDDDLLLPAMPTWGVKKPTPRSSPFILVFNKLILAHPPPTLLLTPLRQRLIFTSKWIRADYAFIRRRWITARKFSTKKSIRPRKWCGCCKSTETVEQRWQLQRLQSRLQREYVATVGVRRRRWQRSWFSSRKFAKLLTLIAPD